MADGNTQRKCVKSDETLFAIIESLLEHQEVGVTELAEAQGLSKSTVYKHLNTLKRYGFVHKNEGRYRLGLKFLTLGGRVRDRNSLYRLARSKVQELAKETDQMVSFIIRDGTHGVFVLIRNDRYGLRTTVPLGTRYYLHQNGGGKAILANLPDEGLEAFIEETGLPAKTHNTITKKEAFRDEIKTIREQGYSISNEERVEGVQSVAVPVESPNSTDMGALTLASPVGHLSEDHIHTQYADTLMEAARELELQAKYNSG